MYRINSKTIKKINVKLGPTVKPLPAETREKTDNTNASKPAPVVEPERSQVGEELSDTEAAEKENIENYDDSSQKAEAARSKVANKVHIILNEPFHEKTCFMPYANNKGADQSAQSDQHLCCSLLR